MQIKVLKGMSSWLHRERHKQNVYETNVAFKAFALYTYFQNRTTSGVIKYWVSDEIAADIGISRASFYNYLSYAKNLGLIKEIYGAIFLTSYAKLCEKYLIDKQFVTINYNPNKDKLEKSLKALEYQEAKEWMAIGLEAKVRNNPQVKAAYGIEATQLGATEEVKYSHSDLMYMQKHAFSSGGLETTYDTLFIPNPDLNRTLFTIAEKRKMKSHVSAQYEVRQLEKAGLLVVTKRDPVICPYKGSFAENKVKGRLSKRRRGYDPENKVVYWYLPNHVELSPTLLAQPENARPPSVV